MKKHAHLLRWSHQSANICVLQIETQMEKKTPIQPSRWTGVLSPQTSTEISIQKQNDTEQKSQRKHTNDPLQKQMTSKIFKKKLHQKPKISRNCSRKWALKISPPIKYKANKPHWLPLWTTQSFKIPAVGENQTLWAHYTPRKLEPFYCLFARSPSKKKRNKV